MMVHGASVTQRRSNGALAVLVVSIVGQHKELGVEMLTQYTLLLSIPHLTLLASDLSCEIQMLVRSANSKEGVLKSANSFAAEAIRCY